MYRMMKMNSFKVCVSLSSLLFMSFACSDSDKNKEDTGNIFASNVEISINLNSAT